MSDTRRNARKQGWWFVAMCGGILLATVLTQASSAGRAIVKKGPYLYYIHPTAGLIALSPAFQILSVVSLPGGAPQEVDVDGSSGNVFVACDGGVALVRSGSDRAEWIEDSLSTFTSMGGSTITNHQGFDQVVVADGHLAFFSHPCDEALFSDLRGMVVTMPVGGGPLREVTAEPGFCAERSRFHDLVYIPDSGNVVSVACGGKYRLFDGVQGMQLMSWASTSYNVGSVWDTYLYLTNGEYWVGGSFLRHEDDTLPIDAALMFAPSSTNLQYGARDFLPNPGSARSIRLHRGTYFASHVDGPEPGRRGGISAFDEAQHGYYFETDPPPVGSWNGVSYLTVAGDVVYGSCDFGILGISASGVPARQFYVPTPGQGPLCDLGDGSVVGAGRGGGGYVSAPAIYVVHATPGGGVYVVDLSDAAMRFEQALPPLVQAGSVAPVELRGSRFTPDCAVYLDLDLVGRDRMAGRNVDDTLAWPLTNVVFRGFSSLTVPVPPLEFGPIDVVVRNNGGRQWAVRTNAIVVERPPVKVETGDWLIVDSDADPYHLAPPRADDAPGAVFHINPADNRVELVSMAADMPDPMDLVWDPFSQGYYFTVGGYAMSKIRGGDSGVFSLNITNGFFNTWRNLVAGHASFEAGEQLLILPNGSMLYLDSCAYTRTDGTNVASDGVIYEIARSGGVRTFSTSPYWNGPRTMDVGPDGRIYVCDPGNTLFGGGVNTGTSALHAVDPDTGRADVLFRNSRLGFPMDAAFGPDGWLRVLSLVGTELDHVELLEVDPQAAPEQAVRTLLDSRDNGFMASCLAFKGSELYLMGSYTGPSAWGLYRFVPSDPAHPVLVQSLGGLVYPRRLLRAGVSLVTPRPRLYPVGRQGSNLRLTWTTSPTLKLQTCVSVGQDPWTDVPEAVGKAELAIAPTNTAAFFRLVETQP